MITRNLLTEGRGNVGYKYEDSGSYEVAIHRRIKSNRKVRNCQEQIRKEDVNRQISQCFAQKVDVSSVHSVEMFSEKYRNFRGDNLQRNKLVS